MRGVSLAAVLMVWLVTAMPARAGLYSTDEHLLDLVFGHPANYAGALRTLQQVVAVELTNDPKSPRGQVLQRIKELEEELRDGRLSSQGRFNLSTYYVRLNQPDKAVALLEAVPRMQRDWMALSNLATAYQLTGNLDRADSYLEQALANWPKVSTATSSWRLNWLRIVESYQLRLIRARRGEVRGGAEGIDNIFPGLRFIGPSGEYERGILAAEQWAKLPAEHTNIVKLLVLWMPFDARLRWLLAELVNANGDPDAALDMMNELSETRRFGTPEFAAHYRALRHAKDIADHLHRLRPDYVKAKAGSAWAPLVALLPPAPAVALDAVGSVQAIEEIVPKPLPKSDVSPTADDIGASSAAPTSGVSWTLEWRQIAVSFVAGAVVAALLSLQLREMRKRRDKVQAASRG